MTFGTPAQILAALFSVLFIMAVHQDYFKDVLSRIYANNVWPELNAVSDELNNYFTNTEKRKEMTSMKKEGAFIAEETNSDVCWNCGRPNHMAGQCTRPKHRCNKCYKSGHLEKYCKIVTGITHRKREVNRDDDSVTRKPSATENMRRQLTDNKKKKFVEQKKRKPLKGISLRRAKIVKKQKNYVADDDEIDNDNDDDDRYEEEDVDYGDTDDDDDEEYHDIHGMMKDVVDTVEEGDSEIERILTVMTKSKLISPELIIFLMDTGCRRIHIVKYLHILTDAKPVKATVSGITGGSITATVKGRLPLAGDCLCIPEADANLLSVRRICEIINGRFDGDKDNLFIRDSDDQILLTGTAHRQADNGQYTGFYTCTAADIMSAAKIYQSKHGVNLFPALDHIQDPPPVPRHYTPEQRSRAFKAWNLCRLLGHPGFDAIAKDLDNGAHPDCDLTSTDVKNAVLLYGKCTACIEGKMNNPPTPPSTTPPATEIGEHLHGDIIPFKTVCVGGYTCALETVDEKCGYVCFIKMANKSTPSLCEALDKIIAFYNQHGYTIKKITTDGENNLKATKTYLGQRGIELTNTPAGLHERRAERSIQTLKKRRDAILASLEYELPPQLEAEALEAASIAMNSSSCTASAPYTPFHLVTGRKPLIPQFHFGQVGIFKGVNNLPNEWGIFIGYGDAPGSLLGYFPTRRGIQSRRKFHPHPVVPKDWGFKPRIRNKYGETKRLTDVNQPLNTVPPRAEDLPLPNPDDLPQLHIGVDTARLPAPDAPGVQVPVVAAPDRLRPEPLAQPVAPPPPPPLPGLSNPKGAPMPRRVVPPPPAVAVPTPRESAPATDAPAVVAPELPQPAAVQPALPPPEPPPETRPRRAATQHKGWVHGRHERYGTLSSHAYQVDDPPLNTRVQLGNFFAYYGDFKTASQLTGRDYTVEDILSCRAYRVSLNAALKMKDRQSDILRSIHDEIHNLMKNKVVKPVHPRDITREIHKNTLPSHMFLKFKYKANGEYDKTKARFVAGGNHQDREAIGDTYAPTVNPISVKTHLQVTVSEGLLMAAYDIKGAFLIPDIDRDEEVIYVRVNRTLTRMWAELYPELEDFVDEDGCITFELIKYLYGTARAPNRFNNHVDQTLKSAGFTRLKADNCVYIWKKKGKKIIVSIHVDDMLMSCSSEKEREWFEKVMSKTYELVAQRGRNISYLGMSIDYDMENKRITLKQDGMIADLLKKYHSDELTRFPATPAVPGIFDDPAKIKNNEPADKKQFQSLVMSLLYIGRFTRHDILLPVTVLATRSSNPQASDMSHAMRVVRYLAGTDDVGPTFNGNTPLVATIFADASHCLHFTGHGHGGIIITLGSAPVHCMSYKLKLVTRSSSESELVVLEEASTYAVWYKLLLKELGVMIKDEPITVYQDNMSTMFIASEGQGNFKRTKHLLVRESYVKERIDCGDIALMYKQTRSMSADFLTKATSRPKLRAHLNNLHMIFA